jgi:sugar O-acyltransferase (sialic acid O-acetyltransferase NeuD family)
MTITHIFPEEMINCFMRNIAFIGFGNLGKQIYNMISMSKKIEEYIFFDDLLLKEGNSKSFPFFDYSKDDFKDYDFYVTLGYKSLQEKSKIIGKLITLKRSLPGYIHNTAFINQTAQLKDGIFIYPMCNIDMNVTIGYGVILNNSVTISHDNVIGDCSYLSPGVIVSGFVEIGKATFLGSGSIISNNIKIGSNVIIGAGTVVTRDIPDNSSVIGNPMKILNKKINLI